MQPLFPKEKEPKFEEISILFSALELVTETMYLIVIVCPNKLNEANLNSLFPLIGNPNCLNDLGFSSGFILSSIFLFFSALFSFIFLSKS